MEVAIVGAGPAGLFAAYELINAGFKVTLIDKGKRISERTSRDIMTGIGGSGTFSDGKLHFSPLLSHERILHLISYSEYEEILDYVNEIFTKFGANAKLYPTDIEHVQKLVDNCKINGIHLFVRKIKHIGSDKLPTIIKNFESYLIDKGVKIITEQTVSDLLITPQDKHIEPQNKPTEPQDKYTEETYASKTKCTGILVGNEKLTADAVILAPGRFGARWLQNLVQNYNIPHIYEKAEVGIRIEFPSILMKEYVEAMYEAIFMIRTRTYDDCVRTFCPCPNGMVTTEQYEGFICVNGHSTSEYKSKNSNFAFLTEIKLTEPVENTTLYAKSIAQLATTIGGGKPIIQRLADLKAGRRSTWERIKRSFVEPTLKDATPGDISMALPHRIVTNLLEGIESLEKVMPGINHGDNIIYAPEIKLRSSKIKTNKFLETNIKGLFVAGDGAGLSGNIVGAAASGILSARGIINSYLQ